MAQKKLTRDKIKLTIKATDHAKRYRDIAVNVAKETAFSQGEMLLVISNTPILWKLEDSIIEEHLLMSAHIAVTSSVSLSISSQQWLNVKREQYDLLIAQSECKKAILQHLTWIEWLNEKLNSGLTWVLRKLGRKGSK